MAMKYTYYGLILLLTLFSLHLSATTVSKQEALQKALVFLSSKDRNASIDTFSIQGRAEMFKVLTSDGWCLMSSETGVVPVVAYSKID